MKSKRLAWINSSYFHILLSYRWGKVEFVNIFVRAQVKAIATKHIQELEMKMMDIQSMLGTLKNLTHHCHGDNRPD
ncbi:MAG: hypothetical protein H0V66_04745 [Bdellovibrionales bacterium]|nr:hypothetical protein [Bdellovibrionales bacterium]